MHGCSGGACMVALEGGSMVAPWGACMVALGGAFSRLLLTGRAWNMTRYGDMINEWAVHILLECILVHSLNFK